MNYPAASHGVSKARQQHEMNHPTVSCGATISKQASGHGPAGQSDSQRAEDKNLTSDVLLFISESKRIVFLPFI